MNIELSKQAAKSLEAIYRSGDQAYDRILAAIESLAEDPGRGRKLQWALKGDYAIRVGSYRIIYTFNKSKLIIYIIDIGHRKAIYKNIK